MALTLTKLRNRIKLALGGVVSSNIDQDDIINEAGRQLVIMHDWKWLERPPASLNFTLNTAYVPLPADFGELIELQYNADALNLFTLGSFADVAKLRTSGYIAPAQYVGVIVNPGQATTAGAPPVPRIELVPTPVASVTAALTVWYRAAWTEMTFSDGSEVPNVPIWLHSLLSELVTAVAQGYNEKDAGSMSARLGEIQTGPLFENAKTHDGSIQPDYGYLGLGAAAMPKAMDPINWTSVAAPAPI